MALKWDLDWEAPVPMTPMTFRAYLAGPMTGLAEYNFPAFRTATAELRELGWEVFSPAEVDEAAGFNPKTDRPEPLRHYMKHDLPAVLTSDVLVVLPGWQGSKGARLEVHAAVACEIPVLSYPSLDLLDIDESVLVERDGELRDIEEPVPGWSAPEPGWPTAPERERHPSSQRFHEILGDLGELHDRKQADYGTDEDPFANVRASEMFGVQSWLGAIIRLNDKVNRIAAFAVKGELKNEPLIDAFNDIAVYAIIARVLYEEAPEIGDGNDFAPRDALVNFGKRLRETLDEAGLAGGRLP